MRFQDHVRLVFVDNVTFWFEVVYAKCHRRIVSKYESVLYHTIGGLGKIYTGTGIVESMIHYMKLKQLAVSTFVLVGSLSILYNIVTLVTDRDVSLKEKIAVINEFSQQKTSEEKNAYIAEVVKRDQGVSLEFSNSSARGREYSLMENDGKCAFWLGYAATYFERAAHVLNRAFERNPDMSDMTEDEMREIDAYYSAANQMGDSYWECMKID